jgi:hypothetical protein
MCMVGTIFYSHIDTWWVPYFIHTLIRGGCHILFTHWYMNMVPTMINVWTKYDTHHDQCENKIWYPPRINVWISHILFTHWYMVGTIFYSHIDCGGCHILFTHWYKVGAKFCSHIDKWWVPYFIHTLIRGGCHIQCVNKIWYPPLINARTKYGTHHVSMCE